MSKRTEYDPASDIGFDVSSIYKPLRASSSPFYGIFDTHRAIDHWPINLDPDFQRGHVWNPAQQSRFIGHMLEGGHIPNVVVNSGPGGDWPVAEMLDGKQRVTACLEWVAGTVGAELSDGRVIYAVDLSKRSRRKCTLSIGLAYDMVRLTRLEALELYIKLNRGGVVHEDHEIERVKALLAAERDAAQS